MKKKLNESSLNNETGNSFINNSFNKQNNFTSNTNTLNLPPSSERKEALNRGKKILNQQEIINWQKKKIKIILTSNKEKQVNSNLLSINYVKPLKFAFKNHLDEFNNQFESDRNDSRIVNQKKHFQQIMNNNYYKYNFNTLKCNDKKEKISQYSSTNSLIINGTNKQTGKTSSVKALKNKNNSDKKNKIAKNSSINNTDKKDKNKKLYVNHYTIYDINQKEIINQEYYRGHLIRNKLLTLLNVYEKYKKLFDAIKNLKYYKKTFWSILTKMNGNNNNNANKDNKKSKSKIKNKNIKYIICKIDDINYFGNSKNVNIIIKEEKDKNNHNIKNKKINYIIAHIDNFNYRSNIYNIRRKKNYIISNTENINYNGYINDIKKKNNNVNDELEKEKKLFEERIKVLNEENKKLNEKLNKILQENEKKCEKFKKEIDNLNKVNKENLTQKEEILKELKLTKENYEKILKSSSKDNLNKKHEININNIDNDKENTNIKKVFNDDDLYEAIESKTIINEKSTEEKTIENNENDFNKTTNDINEGELNNKESQEKRKKKVCFKDDKTEDNNKENEIDKIKKEEEIKKEKEKEELKRRLRRSRSLRRILNKKSKEKKELLRASFLKFYKAGLTYKLRSSIRRRTVQFNAPLSANIMERLLKEKNDKINEEKKIEEKEKKELVNKRKQLLEKIISKIDRKDKIVLKNSFQKFYLKVKLDSVQSIIKNDKNKKKKKKKVKKHADGKNVENAENKDNKENEKGNVIINGNNNADDEK